MIKPWVFQQVCGPALLSWALNDANKVNYYMQISGICNLEFQEMKPANMKQHWLDVLATIKRWWVHVLLNFWTLAAVIIGFKMSAVLKGWRHPPPPPTTKQEAPLNIQNQTWFYSISSRSIKHLRVRNGDEFQQRGQEKSANSLQMFSFFFFFPGCVREHDVALADEKRKDSTAGESSMNYEQKRPTPAFLSACLLFQRNRKESFACRHIFIHPTSRRKEAS